MNFLAHLALSHFSADLQVGNFLGDFVRGRRQLAAYPPGVIRGVELHRAIDRATDDHPAVRQLTGRLRPRHGRYAGVVSDVAFDHFLHRDWSRLGPAPFGAFCHTTYATLAAARDLMPPRVAGYVACMVSDDWLGLYTTPAGMARVFARLRPRLSRPELLDGVNDTLREEAAAFRHALRELYPALQELSATYRG